MSFFFRFFIVCLISWLLSCSASQKAHKKNVLSDSNPEVPDSPTILSPENNKATQTLSKNSKILGISRKELIHQAQAYMGVPYRYGSANPTLGFDCSGFLYYLFQQLQVKVPRTANDYLNIGEPVSETQALPGDLILFTENGSSMVTHIGILTAIKPSWSFIHASSSKGVIISPFSNYWAARFLKVICVLQ